MRLEALICACALALAACGDKKVPATQVVIAIESDLAAGTALDRVRVEVHTKDGADTGEAHDFVVKAKPKAGEVKLPFSFVVSKNKANSFRLFVLGYVTDDKGKRSEVAEQKVDVAFQEEKTVLVKVFLGGACNDKTCSDDQSCYLTGKGSVDSGECGPIRVAEITEVEPGDELKNAGGAGQQQGRAGEDGEAGDDGEAGTEGGEAGDDGEAGSEGGEAGDGPDDCIADCSGRDCGSDGCNGTCGECGDGAVCNDGYKCECEGDEYTYYADADGDQWGDGSSTLTSCDPTPPSGYTYDGTDCCDSDDRANPSATTFQTTSTNCGGYDFNCDGQETPFLALIESGICCGDYTNGWVDTVPYCGEQGTAVFCDEMSCEPISTLALQDCL